MNVKRFVFLFFFLSLIANVYGQSGILKARLDSLKTQLNTAIPDTERVNVLIKIVKVYSLDPVKQTSDSMKQYVQSALAAAREINYKKGEADALLFKGKYELTRNNHLDYATLYFLQSLAIYDSLNNNEGIANCNLQLGVLSYELQSYTDAINYFQKSIRFQKDTTRFLATGHYLIALSLSEIDSIEKAISMFDIALKEYHAIHDEFGVLGCNEFIGKMYTNSGNYEKAVQHLQHTIETTEYKNDSASLVPAYAFLSTAYLKLKDYKKAIRYATFAYRLGNTAGGTLYIKEAESTLHLAYEKTGNIDKAYFFLTQLNSLKDSMYSNTILQRIAKMNSEYGFDQQLNNQKAEQEKKDMINRDELQKQKLLRDGFIGGFVLMLLFAGVFFKQRNRIKKGNEALQVAKERAEQSEKFKQQFLANMSHEIRTPMNALMGMTNLLIDKNPRGDQLNYLDGMKKSSEILLHIINDILDLSKIEAGKIELEEIDFSIRESILQVKQILSHRAEEKGLQLITDVNASIPEVVIGDPVRLNQVLMNLAGNAVKFTRKGSVAIKVENGSSESAIRFSIIDTGIGIPENKLQSVFESFSQAHSSDTRKFGGTGLGLTISKQLVELMGGTLGIESEEGAGSVFSFELNYVIGSEERLNAQKSTEQIDGSILNGLKILIVDDNEYNRIVTHDTLTSNADVEIAEAVNGKEAIELVSHGEFDVILMDVQMPVMDGYDATRYIREELASPKNQIPVIALTASVVRSDLDKCRAAGMNDYVPKPFKPSQLIAAVAKAAGREIRLMEKKGMEKKYETKSNSIVTDLSYLEKFCEGDRVRMKKYIDLFTSSAPMLIEKVQSSLAKNDLQEIASQVHGFKTKWIMMGMNAARDLALKIEMQCREESPGVSATENISTLISQIRMAINELEQS